MIIYLGADHAGLELKEKLEIFLKDVGYDVDDKGAYELNSQDDYPDFIAPVAKSVSENSGSRGIIIGGSGQGEAMQANRFKRVRTAVYYGGDLEVVKKSREHNDSNILSLGARFLTEENAMDAVKAWLATEFSGEEKYKRRIEEMDL